MSHVKPSPKEKGPRREVSRPLVSDQGWVCRDVARLRTGIPLFLSASVCAYVRVHAVVWRLRGFGFTKIDTFRAKEKLTRRLHARTLAGWIRDLCMSSQISSSLFSPIFSPNVPLFINTVFRCSFGYFNHRSPANDRLHLCMFHSSDQAGVADPPPATLVEYLCCQHSLAAAY